MKLTVITPSFMQGQFIERTILSVLSQQSEFKTEYLIYDGGSDDNTLEMLTKYHDQIKWVSKKDKGQAHAVNKGLKESTGDIIGWINSDDTYHPDAFKHVYNFFKKNPQANILYGLADHIDINDNFINQYPVKKFKFEQFLSQCFICQPAVFFRRKIVDKYGFLDESLNYCMDYEYWLRLMSFGEKFFFLNKKLAYSRLYKENKTLLDRRRVFKEICFMLKSKYQLIPELWFKGYINECFNFNLNFLKHNFFGKYVYHLVTKFIFLHYCFLLIHYVYYEIYLEKNLFFKHTRIAIDNIKKQ